MLDVRSVVAGYGKATVLHGVSLRLHPGEIVTLVGPNGSGKSTLVKALCNLAEVFSGSVVYRGRDVTGADAELLARDGVGYVPQRENVFPSLTVRENLELGTFARRHWRRAAEEIARVYELFPVLKERSGQRAETLSGGERQMLAIGRALVGGPAVLLLDEPTAALSHKFAREIFEKVQAIQRTGVGILLVEQNTAGALAITDRAYVLVSGEVALSGTAEDVRDNEEVVQRVFGAR